MPETMDLAERQRTVFFVVAITHLFAVLIGEKFQVLAFATKPLLLPALMFLFYNETKGRPSAFTSWILAALFLSWTGDVVLLFQERGSGFFIAGLLAFLFAHCCYIIAFQKTTYTHTSILKKHPWTILLFVLYGLLVFRLIKPGLGGLMIPVVVYMVVILLMGLSALNRMHRVPPAGFRLVFAGALLFMLSDSLLAINKFRIPFPFSSFGIMLTYIAAQYLIVHGSLLQIREPEAALAKEEHP